MKKFYNFCVKIRFWKLANALVYAEASKYKWKMLPYLSVHGITDNWFTSFINGWNSGVRMGWIHEYEKDANFSS